MEDNSPIGTTTEDMYRTASQGATAGSDAACAGVDGTSRGIKTETRTGRLAMKRFLAAAAMVAAVMLGQVAPAIAATGPQTFSLFAINDRQTAIASGPVAGVGSVTPIDDDSDLLSFSSGTLRLNHPQTGGDFELNPVTCVAKATFTGTYTLSEGTGVYTGVSGSGHYSGRGVFRFERNADGTCSEEDEVFRFFVVRASGTTSLP